MTIDGHNLIDSLIAYVDNTEMTLDRLREENQEIKKETYKDKQISELVEEIKLYRDEWRRGFPISGFEKEMIDKWYAEHEVKCPYGHGCSGGKYTYHFTPTGLGTVGKIVCGTCKESFCFREL